jgi:hypothetical protein
MFTYKRPPQTATVPGYRSRDPEFDSRRYQIFSEVIGLERGPLNLVRIIEELLQWKISGSGSRNSRLTAVGSVALTTRQSLSVKVDTNFADIIFVVSCIEIIRN